MLDKRVSWLEAPSNADLPDHAQDAHGSVAHQTPTGELLLSLGRRISKLKHNKGVLPVFRILLDDTGTHPS